jgi:prolyl 4-hydroxylase
MKFESLAPDLQSWFRDMVKRGTGRDALLKSLLGAGYQERYARDAIDAALKTLPKPPPPPPVQPAATPVAETIPAEAGTAPTLSQQLVQMPNTIATVDREIHMLFALTAPRIVLFGNLLSADECEQMIEMSRGKLGRSSVVNNETGAYDIHPHRTSYGTYFDRGENDLIRRIEQRIADLVQYPVENGEPIQILHYEPGGEYKPHYDYFDPRQPGNEQVLTQGGPAHRHAGDVPERCRGRRFDGVPRGRRRRFAAPGQRGLFRLLFGNRCARCALAARWQPGWRRREVDRYKVVPRAPLRGQWRLTSDLAPSL